MSNARPTPGLWCSPTISGLPLQIPRPASLSRALNCWKCFSCCSCCAFCTHRHHTAGKIPVAGNFFICRKLPTKSAIRISTLPSGRLPSAIQPGSRFSGRAEIRTFRLLKRAVAHAASNADVSFPRSPMTSRRRLRSSAGTQNFCLRQRLIRRSKPATGLFWKMPRRSRTICRELSSSQRRMIPLHVPQSAVFRRSFTRHRFSTICSGIQKVSVRKKNCMFFFFPPRLFQPFLATAGTSAAAYF